MTDSDPNAPGVPLSSSSPVPPPPPGAVTEAMPVTANPEEITFPVPWYKKPAGIAMIVIGVLLIAGLIFGLIWAASDDNDAEVVTASVVLVPKDVTGAGLDRGFLAEVTATGEFPNSFVWIEPKAAPGPGGIGGSTDGSDRVTFAWAPAAEVVEPAAWSSTITLVGNSPAGFTPPGPVVECVLVRPDEQNTTISMDVVVDPPDPTVDQTVTYTFPNHEFLRGDTVTCELVSQLPPETTTTVPESTTTVPETTVPETTVPVTDPPAQPANATEALVAAGNYGTFLSLASSVESVQRLLDGAGPITVFAPNDAAFEGFPLPEGVELEQLLLSHIVSTETIDASALFDGRTEVLVASNGKQMVVTAPPEIGDATVVQPDLLSTSGVSHGIDRLLPTVP